MQIDLKKLAELEVAMAGNSETMPATQTTNLIFNALSIFFSTPVEDQEELEHLFPILKNLEELGVVTDAPEIDDELDILGLDLGFGSAEDDEDEDEEEE